MGRSRLVLHGRVGGGTDTTPDAFTFTDVSNAPLSTVETSNTVTVAGLGSGVSVAVTVTGGTYSKNGGSYTSSAGTAQNGDTFAVRHTSSASNSTATNTTLTIGGVSDTYTSTTLAGSGSVPNPTWDTSIGEGVDSIGAAYLPLDTTGGARRIYVNNLSGYGGSDSNSGLSPSTPLLTSVAAASLLRDGYGDQVLFPWGATHFEEVPSLRFRTGGKSIRFPWQIGAYDPTDPTNETKIRQGPPSDSQLPRFVYSTQSKPWTLAGGQQNVAIRNIKFEPYYSGSSPDTDGEINFGLSITYSKGGFLFERIRGIHFGINGSNEHALDDTKNFSDHVIVRRCALDHTYDNRAGAGNNGSLMYWDGYNTLTIEGNVLDGAGHKDDASRMLATTSGGGTQFRHALYQQDATAATCRFNLITSSCSDAGSHRGSTSDWFNVHLDCPISLAYGDGTLFNTYKRTKNGQYFDSRYNFVHGSTFGVPDSGALGWGIISLGGLSGSGSYDCILLNGPGSFSTAVKLHKYDYAPSGWNETDSDLIHSYHEFNGCIFYSWSNTPVQGGSQAANTISGDYFTTPINSTVLAAKTHPTYNNCVWDDVASGSNLNKLSVTYPSIPANLNAVATAGGFANYSALRASALADTNGIATTVRGLLGTLFAGFSKTIDTVAPTFTVSATGGTGTAAVTVNSTKRGGIHHLVAVPHGATAPSEQQIRGRRDSTWEPVADGAWALIRSVVSGNQPVQTLTLSAGTYDIYAICDYYCTLSSIATTTVTVS